MELEFRRLKASEVDARTCQINNGGVQLLLYKDARCDQNILDETVGPLGWQRHHSRENANCIVSIYDKDLGQWVDKEDTGVKSFSEEEKGLASDSFKRSCFNWGIGRELYTAPNIFIPKEGLQCFTPGDPNDKSIKGKCYDEFRVSDLQYVSDLARDEGYKTIKSVRIDVLRSGNIHHSYEFDQSGRRSIIFSESGSTQTQAAATPNVAAPVTQVKPVPETTKKAPVAEAEPVPTDVSSPSGPFSDDEIILIGNCRGQKYGEAKETDKFKSFLKWVRTSKTSYNVPEQQRQFDRFRSLTTAS